MVRVDFIIDFQSLGQLGFCEIDPGVQLVKVDNLDLCWVIDLLIYCMEGCERLFANKQNFFEGLCSIGNSIIKLILIQIRQVLRVSF